MQGWIKLHRQLADNPLWLIKPFSEGQAWVDLLLITSYEGGFIKTKNGTIVKVNRGECGYSKLTLSDRWGWSRGKVTRYLSLLEQEKMIQQKNTENTTIISILNYESYQNSTINDTINDTINGQQTDTIKKDKNDKNININNNSSSSSCILKNKTTTSTTDISDLNEDRIKDLNNFYGEYKNVHLTSRQLDSLKAMILNDSILNNLINQLSENIEQGKEKLYDDKTPAIHFVRLKKYWQYQQNKAVEDIKKQKVEEEEVYNYGIG